MTVKQSTISVVAAVAFVLMALMLAGSVYFINGAVTSQKRAIDVRAEATQLGFDLENASRYLSNEVRKFAVSGKAEHLDNYWKEVDVTKTGEKVVASLKALGVTPEELALINLSNQKSLALTDTETRAMRLVLESQGVAEAKMPKEVAAFKLNELDQKLSGSEKVVLAGQILFDGAYDQGEAAVMQPIADFQAKMKARLNQEVEAAAATTATGITALIFLAVLVPLGMAIVLGILHFKSGQPVVAYIKALHGRDANDRSFALNPAGTKELHALAEAFNDQFRDNQRQLRENEELVENLTALVQRVVDNAERLGEASAQLSAASEQAGAATQQIATTIQEVARGNQDTSASAQETSASVEQLVRAIDQIARGSQDQVGSIEKASLSLDQLNRSIALVAGASRQLASAGEQTAVAANSGTETVKKSARGMDAIRDGSATATSKVQELEKHSEQIGSIVEAIDDIAEQTNLLALNAAIEAARAGEHGRGFAVVADEVRKLAERSSRETKQIASLIAQVQRGTQEAVAAMERGALEVEAGTRLAEETSLALQNILTAVGVANGQVTEIVSAVSQMEAASREVVALMDSVSAVVEESTAATQEMAASSQHVRGAIEKVAAVSEETSASAEEVSASTEEMSAQVEEMVAQSQDLARMAEELQAAVAQFKKGQGDSEQFSVSMRRRRSDWGQPGAVDQDNRGRYEPGLSS